ncbi:rab-GTPase-TBC domain-containing protein [Irpex lacteus]|nr:rab-GTPase-TBC domain-containing protein [Irpex lacteus]
MATSSATIKTPTHAHPLLADDLTGSSRGRRRTGHDERQSSNNYFTLRAQLENKADEAGSSANWDGSVRGKTVKRKSISKPTVAPPLIVVESSSGTLDASSWFDDALRHEVSNELGAPNASDILDTHWHEYSDEDIQSTVSRLASTSSPSDPTNDPYHTTLRVLSSAVHKLSRARVELEEGRRRLMEKEAARRVKATELMKELQPSERDVARRVVQALFPEDDEEEQPIHKKQSLLSLTESLSEAIENDGPMSQSLPEPSILSSSSIERPAGDPDMTPTEPSSSRSTAATTSDYLMDDGESQDRPNQSTSDTEPSKLDRSSLGDWMGTWWQRKARNRMSSAPSLSTESISETDKIPDADGLRSESSDTSSMQQPTTPVRTRHRKASSRSVFGTLGFSLLNPASSSSHKRRATAIPAINTQPEVITPSNHDSNEPTQSDNEAASVQESAVDNPHYASSAASSIQVAGPDTERPQGTAIRAIVNATRVMTSDPSSILIDRGEVIGQLITRLAYELARNARDSGLDIRKPARPRKETTRGHERPFPRTPSSLSSNESQVLARSASGGSDSSRNYSLRQGTMTFSALASPLFGSFMTQQSKPAKHAADNSHKSPEPQMASQPPQPPKAGSVPLESIIPTDSKPPTQYLSRTYTPLTSRDFHFSLPISDAVSVKSSGTESHREAMTDRFGFIYEVAVYDLLLLLRAKYCENTAPACLTGVKVADRKEDNNWSDDETQSSAHSVEIFKESCEYDCGDTEDATSISSTSTRPALLAAQPGDSTAQSSRPGSPVSTQGRPRSSTVTPATNKKIRAKSSTSVLSVDADTPTHVCPETIKRILGQLKDIHDQRQAAQRKEWDAFVNQRSKSLRSTSGVVSKSFSGEGRAAAMLGLGTTLDEEELSHSEGLVGFAQLGLSSDRREFDRLVRQGIPLAYRSKVWFECSGALEMREPGLFADLLSEVDEGSSVVREIEKDVGRTMPLNIFFGRTGAGVDKLRRVLKAYSRRNPAVGYCQGMNLVTSTLLLVHADEEEAFWMLCAIVERISPADFFSPSLISSRACPLVLLEYVQEMLPKLDAHLTNLGVDLGAISFSWFLSLFTDCLPIETLFRVWDVFMVDGLDVLFRIALAILRNNEQELLECDSIPAVYVALESLPNRMWRSDKLLKREIELRNVVVHSDILKRREAHSASLRQIAT